MSAAVGQGGPTVPGSSTAVLVMTDVEGSTRLWAEYPEAMNEVMARHHGIVHAAITAHGGWRPVDQGEGDAVFAAFESATSAVAAVVAFQRELAAEAWPAGIDIRVRVGVHAGEVTVRDGNLFGSTVNRCARLRGLGAGGQVLLSAPVFELVRDRLPDGVTVADLGEHRMKDLARSERVHQLVISGLPHEFPPLASLDRARHNLPVQTSSFLGRDREVAELVDLVTRERLVTITGFGGMGKTRLALQVAAELATGDGDGVWFVDLSAVTDPAQVPTLIATTLGIGESADGVLSGLAAGVRDKRLLLILDNLEQLLPDAALMVDQIVRAAPDVRVLATCREPLRLRGEHEYPIAPLPLPPIHRGGWTEAEVASLSTYSAVSLFLSRASGVRPDFTLTPSNAAAVTAICARLDGLPLAIELAAARTRVMSPDALLPRLEHSLKILTGGSRDLPARHQTLRATIAWSYDALEPGEQQLLARLSIFPGTFTLDAAEQICGPALDEDRADSDVLEGISALVDRSLLRVHPAGRDQADDRYDLLVSIRAYADECLGRTGDRDLLRARHRAYYTAQTTYPLDFTQGDQERIRSAIAAELHNVRAALTSARESRIPDQEIELAANVIGELAALAPHEAIVVIAQARARAGGALDLLTRLLVGSGSLSYLIALTGDATDLAAEALTAARAVGDPSQVASALFAWLEGGRSEADANRTIDEVREIVASLPATGNVVPRWRLESQLISVQLERLYVEPDAAIESARAAVRGSTHDESAISRGRLGVVLMNCGQFLEAESLLAPFEAPVPVAATAYGALGHIFGTLNAAQLRLGLGDFDTALRDLDMVRERLDDLDLPALKTWTGTMRAAIHRGRGEAAAAEMLLVRTIEQADPDIDPLDIGLAQWLLSVICREIGQPARAADLLAEAWTVAAPQAALRLDLVLECLLEGAMQLRDREPRAAARLLGIVLARRRTFALVDGVFYDTDLLRAQLSESLGWGELDGILERAEDEPLPEVLI